MSSQTCCKSSSEGSTETFTKMCTLQTPEGQFDCECICKCERTSSANCTCDCKCTPETARKTAEGKYQCECTCKC